MSVIHIVAKCKLEPGSAQTIKELGRQAVELVVLGTVVENAIDRDARV